MRRMAKIATHIEFHKIACSSDIDDELASILIPARCSRSRCQLLGTIESSARHLDAASNDEMCSEEAEDERRGMHCMAISRATAMGATSLLLTSRCHLILRSASHWCALQKTLQKVLHGAR